MNPSYSTDGVNFTTLPGDYMIGGRPDSYVEDNTVLRTGNGRRFTYNNYSQKTFHLIWEINTVAHMNIHRAFHDALFGGVSVWFSISGAGVSDAIKVLKDERMAGFDPQEMRRTSLGIRWELVYELIEELV